MLYYLYICIYTRVALILELKIHTKNINTYTYTRTNFQERLERGREKMRVANERTQNARIFPHVFVFYEEGLSSLVFRRAKSSTNTRAVLLCFFVFFPKQPQGVVVLDKPFFFAFFVFLKLSFVCLRA